VRHLLLQLVDNGCDSRHGRLVSTACVCLLQAAAVDCALLLLLLLLRAVLNQLLDSRQQLQHLLLRPIPLRSTHLHLPLHLSHLLLQLLLVLLPLVLQGSCRSCCCR
jgi:hypothetical protein